MPTFDELFYIDKDKDPEGYAEQQQMKAEAHARVFKEISEKRSLAAKMLTFTDESQLSIYLESLPTEEIAEHRRGAGVSLHLIEEQFIKSNDYKYQEAKQELLKLAMQFHVSEQSKMELLPLLTVDTEEQLNIILASYNNQQLAIFTKLLRSLEKKADRLYHLRLDKEIYSISKTTLKALMKDTNWNDVRDALLKHHPNQDKLIDEYARVFGEFQKMPTVKNKDNTVITVDKWDDGFDISGIKPGDIQSYAIEFCRWEEWLGFYVHQRQAEELGTASFIALCMWEMTFVGFHQEDIQDEINELTHRVDELKKEHSEESSDDDN